MKEQHAAVAAILLQMTGLLTDRDIDLNTDTTVGIGIGQNKCEKIIALDCYLDLARGFIDYYV